MTHLTMYESLFDGSVGQRVRRANCVLRVIAVIMLAGLILAAQDKGPAGPTSFHTERLAPNVYAFIRNEQPSLWFTPNNGLIVGHKYAIVVDSNISSEYTRAVLAEIRKITDKPIRYVINTHWHEDHIIGNNVYREAFRDVKFIGHSSMEHDLATTGLTNRQNSLKFAPGLVKNLRDNLANEKDFAGKPITDEERQGYRGDLDIIEAYLAEAATVPIRMPDVVVNENLDITDDGSPIKIRFLGRAHTAADLVVYLPREKIAFSGDLTAWPVPLIGSTSYPLDYAATLEKLTRLGARTYVPGHGPIMRNVTYVRSMIDLINYVTSAVRAAVLRGDTLEQTRKSLDLEPYRKRFCGDSQHKSFVFANYVTQPAVKAAFDHLTRAQTPKK